LKKKDIKQNLAPSQNPLLWRGQGEAKKIPFVKTKGIKYLCS